MLVQISWDVLHHTYPLEYQICSSLYVFSLLGGGMRERGGGVGGFVHAYATCFREWDSKGGVNSETR